MNMRWINFPFQPNSQAETTLGHQHWINVTLSTLFCQHWNNVGKHVLAQLSFSTKFQWWNNIRSSTLNRRNSINVVSTLFCQRWNNVYKCTSTQLSFSTNVVSTLMNVNDQRCFNVNLFAGKLNKTVNTFCRLPEWIRYAQMIPRFIAIKIWMGIMHG